MGYGLYSVVRIEGNTHPSYQTMTKNDTSRTWYARFKTNCTQAEYYRIPQWAQECTGGWEGFRLVRDRFLAEGGGDNMEVFLPPGQSTDFQKAKGKAIAYNIGPVKEHELAKAKN